MVKNGKHLENYIRSVREYVENEAECIEFLQKRIQENKEKVEYLAREVQKSGQDYESVMAVARLRSRILNDTQTMKTLQGFALEMKRSILENMSKIKDMITKQQEEEINDILVKFIE